MGPLGELGVLFNPGMRHEMEEKLAKQMIREDEGTGRKGRRGIDLESGVVVIGSDGSSDVDDPAAHKEPELSDTEQRAVEGRLATTDPDDGADTAATDETSAPRSGSKRADASAEPRTKRARSGSKPTGKAQRRRTGMN